MRRSARSRLGQGVRDRGGHRDRQDAGDPADRRVDPGGAAHGRGRQPRARGDAGHPVLERGHRHHRHRPALVPGRPDHGARHGHRRRDPPDLRRARALPGAGQARRLPLHLAQRHRGPGLLRPLPRQRRCARHRGLRSDAQGEGAGPSPEAGRVPQRALHPARDQGEARRGRVRADARRGGAAGGRARRAVEAARHRVLPRRRADPGDPAVSRGRGRAPVPARDDRGRPVGAQRPGPRHGRDLRRPVRQRGGARAATCSTGSISAPTRSCRWPAGCTAGCRTARSSS